MRTDDQAKAVRLLKDSKTVAVVGLSRDPSKDSYKVAAYLKKAGYTVIPVNPSGAGILGEKTYKSLQEIPVKIDMVDIFRPSNEVPQIVEQAIKMEAKAVWMQKGIVNDEAARKAEKAGLDVVMDRCTMVEHKRLTRSWI